MNNFSMTDIDSLSSEEKYVILNKISDSDFLNEKDIFILKSLSYDQGEEIRAEVAEILGDIDSVDNIETESILIRLLNDKNDLVRACVCDSLRYSHSLEVVQLLLGHIKKGEDYLVRGYSVASMAYILRRINKIDREYIDFIYNLLNVEKVKWVKVQIYKAMYLFGEDLFLQKLIDELNNKNFKIRALVVNTLRDIVNKNIQELIKNSLIERLKNEKNELVQSYIETVLEDLKTDNSK